MFSLIHSRWSLWPKVEMHSGPLWCLSIWWKAVGSSNLYWEPITSRGPSAQSPEVRFVTNCKMFNFLHSVCLCRVFFFFRWLGGQHKLQVHLCCRWRHWVWTIHAAGCHSGWGQTLFRHSDEMKTTNRSMDAFISVHKPDEKTWSRLCFPHHALCPSASRGQPVTPAFGGCPFMANGAYAYPPPPPSNGAYPAGPPPGYAYPDVPPPGIIEEKKKKKIIKPRASRSNLLFRPPRRWFLPQPSGIW